MHANGLYPFVIVDPDLEVVSTATIRFAEAGMKDGEPLARVQEILQYMENASVPGGIVGGLQAVGDARLLELLAEAEEKLPNDQLAAAAGCSTGFPSMAAIQFWIQAMEKWADYLDRATDPGSYQYIEQRMGYLASGLTHVFTKAQVPYVLDADRNFGSPWMEPRLAPVRQRLRVSIRQAAGVFGPRIYRLEEREKRPPFDFPHLLRLFGLRSKRDPSTWSRPPAEVEEVLRLAEERAEVSWDTASPETLEQELFLLGVSAEVSRELDYPVPVEVVPHQGPEGPKLSLNALEVGTLMVFDVGDLAKSNRPWIERTVRWEMLTTLLSPALDGPRDEARRGEYKARLEELRGA